MYYFKRFIDGLIVLIIVNISAIVLLRLLEK